MAPSVCTLTEAVAALPTTAPIPQHKPAQPNSRSPMAEIPQLTSTSARFTPHPLQWPHLPSSTTQPRMKRALSTSAKNAPTKRPSVPQGPPAAPPLKKDPRRPHLPPPAPTLPLPSRTLDQHFFAFSSAYTYQAPVRTTLPFGVGRGTPFLSNSALRLFLLYSGTVPS